MSTVSLGPVEQTDKEMKLKGEEKRIMQQGHLRNSEFLRQTPHSYAEGLSGERSLGDESRFGEELAFLFDDLATHVDLDGEFGSVLCWQC